MQGITSFHGKSSISPQIPLSNYLSSTTNSIRSIFDEKSNRVFTSIIKFLEKPSIPVAILSYDMESTSGDILLNTFSSSIKSNCLHALILHVTSKSSTKKQLLQQIKDSIQDSDLVVYIECLEEWPQDLVCFIFEYLIDQPFKTSFVVDISTDPRYLSQILDASILQKITVEQFYFPEFSKITSEVLWILSQMINFPILSSKIFLSLSECRSEANFMKILKSSLLKFFNDQEERKNILINQENLEEFALLKSQYAESLQLFLNLADTPPLNLYLLIEDLHRSIYMSNDYEISLVNEFIGRFNMREFDVYANYDEFLMGLNGKNILNEEEVNRLRSDYLSLPLGPGNADIESTKCRKWKLCRFLPLLRNKIINKLRPLDQIVKKLKNSDLYVLNICDFIDSDLMKITLQQLNYANLGLNGDMQILFRIIKVKGRHLELNQIFNEFCKMCSVHNGLEDLQ